MTGAGTVAAAAVCLEGRACAKINLALEVLGLTSDGYHDIRSCMIELDLADTLTLSFERSAGPSTVDLTVAGGDDDVPRDERNIVVRAARALLDECGVSARLGLRLTKRVPSQAGLGGGSGDAAATLRLLGQALGVDTSRVARVSERIGSDVPFMLMGGAAVAEGRGERLRRIRVPHSWWVVLAQPSERISTAWCYRRWDELNLPGDGARYAPLRRSTSSNGQVDAVARALAEGDLAGVASHLYNDLEGPVYDLHPHLKRIPAALRSAGCEGALMTGSGSCFFGLVSSRARARAAAEAVRSLGRVWVTRTWREGS